MTGLILSSSEVRQIENAAFADGVDNEALMDLAGAGIASHILKDETWPGVCIVYLGKGNNGGDAIVAASHLEKAGWEIWLRMLVGEESLNPLPKKKLHSLGADFIRMADQEKGILKSSTEIPVILLDGLLGIGSRGGLNVEVRKVTREINELRSTTSAQVYAVDLPTGLADDGADPDTVVADTTVTIGFPKEALIQDGATEYVGRISLVELGDLTRRAPGDPGRAFISMPSNLRSLVPRRNFDSHKGNYGRIGIVAGSRGFAGAGVLCAEACARSGAGLIYVFVPEDIYEIVAAKMPPEIMVKPVPDLRVVLDQRLDAVGIGPGIGMQPTDAVLELISRFGGPMVVDADALNLLAEKPAVLHQCAGARLLTPHPGEMARLWPVKDKSRSQIVQEFTNEYPVALLLKGARTIVGARNMPLTYNSSGTPGMATGGSGDVLTGVCAALLGRGISTYDAGRLGAWLCGKASELALEEESEESMLPSDTIKHLGKAFRALVSGSNGVMEDWRIGAKK
jgi:NAD(P)H-hydrate epimerase